MAELDFAEECALRSVPPVYMFVDALGGTTWAPCNQGNMILHQEEWEKIVRRVSAFYESVTPEEIDADNREQRNYERDAARRSGEKGHPKPKRDKSGFVYILQAGPYYKIGKAKNVDARVKQLATLPPFDVELVHTIKTTDSYRLEKELHGRYDNKHKNGEWFELDAEDIEWLKTL